jgi:EcoRII C terminal
MNIRGLLSDCFVRVASKRLSAVEANPEKSNQHEFNGSDALKGLLGLEDKRKIEATFIWLNDFQEGASDEGFVSWYDSRKNQTHRAAEYRLYYPSNAVSALMEEGDTLFLALRPSGELFVIVAPAESEIGNQLLWLFGLDNEPKLEFVTLDLKKSSTEKLDFAARFILDELGVDFEVPETEHLDELLKAFKDGLPTTKIFAEFARKTVLQPCSPVEEPDTTLMAWLDHEEKLFRRHEHFTIAKRLDNGFVKNGSTDVEGFMKFSIGVQNVRKSRMGLSLEHHAEEIFKAHGLKYARGQITEHKNKPDFLFPGIAEYRNSSFLPGHLTMLASKSTCKDRWRQVLSEAERIQQKHLLTLELGISQNQTDEMNAKGLQLVVPRKIHSSYNENQRKWLMDVEEFLQLAKERQKRI